MGFLSGTSQVTSSNNFQLDFSPNFLIGDGNSTANKKAIDQTATQTPKLDDSFGVSAAASVAAAPGSTAGPASLAQTAMQEPYNPQPTPTYKDSSFLNDGNSTLYIIGGVALVGGFLLLKGKK